MSIGIIKVPAVLRDVSATDMLGNAGHGWLSAQATKSSIPQYNLISAAAPSLYLSFLVVGSCSALSHRSDQDHFLNGGYAESKGGDYN